MIRIIESIYTNIVYKQDYDVFSEILRIIFLLHINENESKNNINKGSNRVLIHY